MKRKIYDSLVSWSKGPYNSVPLIAGARQVGKTFIIREFIRNTFENVIELNFIEHEEYCEIFEKDLDVDTLVTEISVRVPKARFVPGKTIIFFDEIQHCPDARTAFKFFVEDGRYRVIASGSLLGIRQKPLRSNPVGFCDEMKMNPLDFEEFLWAMGMESQTTSKIGSNLTEKRPYSDTILETMERYFRIYMIVGGMPEAVSEYIRSKDIQAVRNVQKKIVNGYRDDIAKYAEGSDKDKIRACFDSIPHQLSKEYKKFMYSDIEAEFQPSSRTYERSIDWMVDAAIVTPSYNLESPTEPLEGGKKDAQFKVYLVDTGLLTYMLGTNVAKSLLSGDTRVNKGAAMENVTAQCMVSSGLRPYYFNNGSLEIDFISVLGGNVGAIEVKSGNNTKAKSLKSLKMKYKVARMIKFETGNVHRDDLGIEYYPMFACGFLRCLFPDPRVDLDYDVSDVVDEIGR